MKLTREDLAMMLSALDIYKADYIEVDPHMSCSCRGGQYVDCVKFKIKNKNIDTNLLLCLLTLENNMI